MPRQLALVIFTIIIIYLFWMDRKKIEGVSGAIWIPFIWMFLAGSRYVSQWLNLAPSYTGSFDVYMDGSPIDRAIFLFLILASVAVLLRRRLYWSKIFKDNYIILLFFTFGLISILWSDYPFVALKRWFKTLGAVSIVLVILTEERPYAALGVIMRRLAFLMLPISILFIKYYPDLGKAYTNMGMPMSTGITLQKNSLGEICMLFGIYFCWKILFARQEGIGTSSRLHFSIYLIILTMIAWLLYTANSATALACLFVAICLFLVGRLPAVARKPRRIMIFCVACIVLYGIMQLLFDVQDILISMLGRRRDLTERVPMWEELLSMVKDPLLGYGWQSFLLGERKQIVIERLGLLSPHNGYLDIYLNLGLVGLFFLLGWILISLKKIWHYLIVDYPAAILRLCFILVAVLQNFTESTLFGVTDMFIIFLFATVNVSANTRLNDSRNGGV